MTIELLNIDCMGGKGRRHSEETRRRIGDANKGKLLGRKRDLESVKKGAETRRRGAYFDCVVCSKQFWRQPSAINKGQNKFCSRNCYQESQKGKPKSEAFIKYCRSRVGEKSPTWKGGVTPERIRVRNSKEMADWRNKVFKRDGYKCQACGAISGKGNNVVLHAHHIKPFAEYPELRFDIGNGLTLCKECHYLEHTNV